MVISFHKGELDCTDVAELLDFHFRSMRWNSPPDACHVLPAAGLREPSVTFWSVRDEGALVGICALKELDPQHGEVKSMRTAPEAPGRGIGTRMLAHIVAEARSRGYGRLSLETGTSGPFAAALQLYQRDGFIPCGPFGGYEDTLFTRFFSRTL